LAHEPRGLLYLTFAVLVVSSVSFFRVRLVAFMTVACLVAYTLLMFLHPEAEPPHYAFIGGAAIAVIGILLALHVRRMRILSNYYERARG
jgi:hypothetical protein